MRGLARLSASILSFVPQLVFFLMFFNLMISTGSEQRTMLSRFLLSAAILALVIPSDAVLGKSTYAMSHPWAWKEWMETYMPTLENLVEKNSTTDCVEWVKLCVDDGTQSPFVCNGKPFQMHAVGAYKRETGTMSMEDIEQAFTSAMDKMQRYGPAPVGSVANSPPASH